MDIKNEIIRKIRMNRISTTEVADCLGKTGVFKDSHAVNRGHFAVGNVKWIYALVNQTGAYMNRSVKCRQEML